MNVNLKKISIQKPETVITIGIRTITNQEKDLSFKSFESIAALNGAIAGKSGLSTLIEEV